eukprot:COSAG01_NODE_1095_length_11714_cov_9.062930_16_plen_84_part_00
MSRSCACIGSPCLRHCGHGASIGDGGLAELQRAALAEMAEEGGGAEEAKLLELDDEELSEAGIQRQAEGAGVDAGTGPPPPDG